MIGRVRPRFGVGDVIRVQDRWSPFHVRTPGYVRGARGVVIGVHGAFPNPEELAYGCHEASQAWLYTVQFKQHAVWRSYEGSEADVVRVDLYEHWIDAESSMGGDADERA